MDPARLSAFKTVMGGTPRIWLGGITAYGISTFLNVTIFSRLKAREGAGLLWLRAGIASVLSQIVDTLIFITIAFYGVFPIGELLLGQMLAKVVLSAVLVPPARLCLRRARTAARPALTQSRAWQIVQRLLQESLTGRAKAVTTLP